MTLRRLFYAFSLAWDNIRANLGINAIAIGIISLAMLIFSAFLLAALNLTQMVERWGDKIQVSVYLQDGLTQDGLADLRTRLSEIPEIANLEYISQDQALELFGEMLEGRADILEGLDRNPLPASFELKLDEQSRDIQTVEALAKRISRMESVKDVEYGREWLGNFMAAIRAFELVGSVVGLLVLAAAVFIISNTIKITIYSRRDEIGIMKLVGSTDLYIRLPFMLEGMLQGLMASCLAVLLLWIVFHIVVPFIALPGMAAGSAELVFLTPGLILAIIAGGAGLGLLGSSVSFSEFLNV